MSRGASPEAALRLAAIDPTWSRRVRVAAHDGGHHEWHLLDRPGTDPDAPVILCLHGNPTWSVLWSRLMRELSPAHRVVAPDHLSMGWSERLGAPRRYRDRVLDVLDLVDALGIAADRPLWLVGHDWGGAIAMGVAVERPAAVAGMLLANTGIAVPEGRHAPRLIRLAAQRGLHHLGTQRTPAFVVGTPFLPGRSVPTALRRALAAPYHGARRRSGVADFVADVPFDDRHPSAADIAAVATPLPRLTMPVHLAWGGRDPVFDDSFADDLRGRIPGATLHRWPLAGHLVALEEALAPVLEVALTAAATGGRPGSDGDASAAGVEPSGADALPLWAALDAADHDERIAVADLAAGTTITFASFSRRVAAIAVALRAKGVAPGDRVAVLVPPGVDLLAVVYACWRIGAVTVVADRGLGLRGLRRAVRSARVAHVVGVPAALSAVRLGRWAPGAARLKVGALTAGAGLNGPTTAELDIAAPAVSDPAAVVFTSGATGPAKGVRYDHGQLAAQRDALQRLYAITPDDRFVAAFAPFAVFGPTLGITTGFPDMDVTSPRTLTAEALEAACAAIDATMVFGAPAALANVVRTATGRAPALSRVRLVLSAGAPVPERVADAMRASCPAAEVHTPYGMTEVLPVADISTVERTDIGPGRGVCVGLPVEGCEVVVVPLDTTLPDPLPTGSTGEIAVRAPWMSNGYDRLWHTETLARTTIGSGGPWHRTGDVGHLDGDGRLWVEGRVAHVVTTPAGPVTPVPLEVAAERLPEVARAAAVGVGPSGLEQVVLVVDTAGAHPDGPAPRELTDQVRAALAPTPVAVVWVDRDLPVDIRHNSKIDRTALAATMARRLAGSGR